MKVAGSLLPACFLCLLLVLAVAAEDTREGVFVGYKESGVEGAGGSNGGASADSGLQAGTQATGGADAQGATAGSVTEGQNTDATTSGDAGADLAAAAAAPGRTVLLYTQFGPIKVKLLEELAPRTTAMVWDLAQKRGCRSCAFYRNEAKPKVGDGPPYALLQGRLDLSQPAPREGNIEVKMGHVCFIPETKDFFIAYGDHPEWANSHTVWGQVDEWFATDFIISQQYKETTHPEFGTVMRMLKEEVPIKIAAEGDSFYSPLLGPMHYDEPPL